MKQKTNIEKTAESRNRKGIKDAISVAFRTIIRIQNAPPLEGTGGSNIFLMQNKGKGPPGRVRSPGAGCCLKPDNHPVALKSSKNYYKTKFQHFNKYQISNSIFFNN
ncbi:MAG: hypothetical protein NTY07_00555 [Bacteroidia bacterium]|nr:hypothetical protein [Bacteroidia bacterium]